MILRALLFACLILVSPWPGHAAVADDAGVAAALFQRQVGPLLKRKCAGCHGDGKTLEGELDLRTRATMLRGGASEQAAVVPGKPDESPLYVAIAWQDEDLRMPPKERNRLTAAEVKLVRDWIADGAPWPAAEPAGTADAPDWGAEDGVSVATTAGLSPDWTNRRYKADDIWAYRPIRRPAVPNKGLNPRRINNPIDAFILRKLQQQDIAAAASADRRTLIRRATIDLTGLPPTPEEVEEFVRDESPGAYAALLSRLLGGRHYGEQQARHWLDVVRYADTSGFSNDYERPNAWRYRDYVVRSFNHDKPYDRFVTEQLAGDELEPGNSPEMLVAVGLHADGTMGTHRHERGGGDAATVSRRRDATAWGVTFLATGTALRQVPRSQIRPRCRRGTITASRPFSPRSNSPTATAPFVPAVTKTSPASLRTRGRTARILKEANDVLAGLQRKAPEGHAVAAPRARRQERQRTARKAAAAPRTERARLEPRQDQPQTGRPNPPAPAEAATSRWPLSVYNGPPSERFYVSNAGPITRMPAKQTATRARFEEIHVLRWAGRSQSPDGKGDSPGVLGILADGDFGVHRAAARTRRPGSRFPKRPPGGGWLWPDGLPVRQQPADGAGHGEPHLAMQHFGRGLAPSANNFGKMGGKPSHPELLDWLATWFVDHGWSIKKLHRLIMTSAAYRRASGGPSEAKPELLAGFPPRRLAAEEIRDAMLAVSGELNPEMGGPGVYPQINWEVARQPRHIMGSVAPAYQPSPRPGDRNRRTLYAFRFRTLADPMLEVFNRPASEVSCERRDETTVTPQVFALFNGQFAHDRALALADRLQKQAEALPRQVELAFQLAYGRAPSGEERQLCLAHVAKMTTHHRRHEPVKVELPQTVNRQMVEELTGEEFEWEEPLDLMAEYQPDLQPWDVEPETRGLAELCLVLLNSNEFVYVR